MLPPINQENSTAWSIIQAMEKGTRTQVTGINSSMNKLITGDAIFDNSEKKESGPKLLKGFLEQHLTLSEKIDKMR